MKLFVFMLKKRKAFVHIFFCSLYFVALFALNWQPGGMPPMKALVLVLTGGAGIGIAYLTRHVLILGFRHRRWKWSLLLFFANFFLIGMIGYLIFHGFENPLSDEVVDPGVEHPYGEYARFYVSWYVAFMKYGGFFFLLESWLFWTIDSILSRYWAVHVSPPDKIVSIHPKKVEAGKQNQLAVHFLHNLMSRVYSRLMSGKRMKTKQVAHLVSLVDYGQLNYFRSTQPLTSLTKEMEVIRRLLKMEDVNGIRLRVAGDLRQVEVPAALLPSIVKNMVKHGVVTKKGDALMDIRLEGSTLYITSENKLATKSLWQQQKGGYGLKHIRQLLKEVYGNQAVFCTYVTDGRFSLYLQIDNVQGGHRE